MSDTQVMNEFEFILTHPNCNVDHLEAFYYNTLLANDSLPLYALVEVTKKVQPRLLKEWTSKNLVINRAVKEMGIILEQKESVKNYTINISVNLTSFVSTSGIVKYTWESMIDEQTVQQLLKERSIKVTCSKYGEVSLVGIRPAANNLYTLYIKLKEPFL